jgi:hypothetical protein
MQQPPTDGWPLDGARPDIVEQHAVVPPPSKQQQHLRAIRVLHSTWQDGRAANVLLVLAT